MRYPFGGTFPEMSESGPTPNASWWRTPLLHRVAKLQQREDQVFLVLALVIGALTGLAVIAFIVLTERMGVRLYPAGGAPWRRLLFPVVEMTDITRGAERCADELAKLLDESGTSQTLTRGSEQNDLRNLKQRK